MLRYVEREILVELVGANYSYGLMQTIKVLQIGVQCESGVVWTDVPLGIEETDK